MVGGEDFRPLPLLGNPHLQTVLAALWPGRRQSLAAREYAVRLADGDRVLLHDSAPPGWRHGGRIALVVHGLGGSHRSGAVERVAGLLLGRGLRVVRIDLRGAGRGVGLARRTYHGGDSEDLRAAAEEIHRRSPGSPLTVIGLSLGGNLALKLAGEAADRPLPCLERVAAVSPPIDFVRCSELLALPRNRIFQNHYVRQLVAQARGHQRRFPDLAPVRFPNRLTLRLFDELWTAPRSGFADALDYYRRAAALPLIPRIRVPAFVLTARDDPFIGVESFEGLPAPPQVEVQITGRGGHLGFLGWDGSGGFRWAERRVVEWVCGEQGGA